MLIDISRADFIDKDVVEVINDFMKHASLKNIKVEIKKSQIKKDHQWLISSVAERKVAEFKTVRIIFMIPAFEIYVTSLRRIHLHI